MANLIKTLENELTKGNIYLLSTGDTVNADKLEKQQRKTYAKEFAAGNIPDKVTFESYFQTYLDGLFRVGDMIAAIKNAIGIRDNAKEEPEEPVSYAEEAESEPHHIVPEETEV